jgi:DNA repair protein RadA/Sms
MKGEKTRFVCQNCGADFPKWSGRCDQCGQWNTLVETIISTRKSKFQTSNVQNKPISLKQVGQKKFARIQTQISEFDRVLGDGLVSGSISLLAGEPGIQIDFICLWGRITRTDKNSH